MQNEELCFIGQVSSSRRLNSIKRSGGGWGETQPATFQKCKTGSMRTEASGGRDYLQCKRDQVRKGGGLLCQTL